MLIVISQKNVQILNRVLLSFYSDTPFFFLTRMLKKIFKDLDQGENRQLGNYQENFSIKEDFKKKDLFLFIIMDLILPYSRDENCNKKNILMMILRGIKMPIDVL